MEQRPIDGPKEARRALRCSISNSRSCSRLAGPIRLVEHSAQRCHRLKLSVGRRSKSADDIGNGWVYLSVATLLFLVCAFWLPSEMLHRRSKRKKRICKS